MSAAGNCVLIIDDDRDIHHAVKLILEPRGYIVACRATASEGVEAVGAIEPDVILLDIMLSSPTEGLILARNIEQNPTTNHIPILFISAIGRTVAAELALEEKIELSNNERFLSKPLNAQDLIAAVEQMIGKQR